MEALLFVLIRIKLLLGKSIGFSSCFVPCYYFSPAVPWKFHPELLYRGPSKLVVTIYIIIGTLVGSALGFMIAMKYNKSFNKAVRESVFVRNNPHLIRSTVVRKSLSLPGYMAEFDELTELYENDDGPDNENTSLIGE